jgi:hypothetical protein
VISGYSTPSVYQPKSGQSRSSFPRVFSSRRIRSKMATACGGCAGWRAR